MDSFDLGGNISVCKTAELLEVVPLLIERKSRRYFLYRGHDRLVRDGILCMPCEEFLLNLRTNPLPD